MSIWSILIGAAIGCTIQELVRRSNRRARQQMLDSFCMPHDPPPGHDRDIL